MEKNAATYSILCVDDEVEILELLEHNFSALNFNVITTTSPIDALRIINEKSNEIALIISDFKMPEMNGFDLRQKCLQNFKDIPFVILSGFVSRDEALKGVDLKISKFLSKPIDFQALEKVVLEETADRVANLNEERELLQGFVVDAEGLLEEMESILLSFEEGCTPGVESVNRIFAIAHTIKGSSGFFKPDTVHRFTHHFEDYLTPYKKNNDSFQGEIVGVCLNVVDMLRTLLKAMTNGRMSDYVLEDLLKIFSKVSAIAEGAESKETVAKVPSVSKNVDAKVRDEIRVGVDILDQFMELSGEITVIRNVINKQVRKIEKDIVGNKDVALLATMLDEMLRINGALQDKVVEMRKVPLKNVVRPLQRTIRDLGVSLKKDFQLVIEGENLKVDTSIAEVLGSSLIHMIRNSADHGIESPSDREKAGKNKQGTIKIAAKQVSDKIIVELSDDGKGLKRELIRKKIVEKSIKTQAEAASMPDSELFSMIFESGFSTAAQVTDVSGRGVGMDMVKKSIAKVGGEIKTHSEEGKGTSFLFSLPIPKSVTIVASLLIRAGTGIYSLSQDTIVKVIALNPTNASEMHEEKWEIIRLEGADILEISGSLFPIIDLGRAFSEDQKLRENAKTIADSSGYIVLVKSNGYEFGIRVEELLDLEDSVVKKLGVHLKELMHFAGATFLGDSQIGLILDVIGIANLYGITAVDDTIRKKIVQDQDPKLHQNVREILLMNIGVPGLWGVELGQVSRLEKCSPADLQMSGEQPLIIYRGKTMPIYCLGSMLKYRESPCYAESDKDDFLLLVIERGNHNIGLAIKNIVDLVSSGESLIPLTETRKGVSGGMVIQDQTVTMLDFDAILYKNENTKGDIDSSGAEDIAA